MTLHYKKFKHCTLCAWVVCATITLFINNVKADVKNEHLLWKSVVLSFIGDGWSIDRGTASVNVIGKNINITIQQADPKTMRVYDYITINGTKLIDNSVPNINGASGNKLEVLVKYYNTDQSSFSMTGTYRKICSKHGEGCDEIIILYEDYNVITLSRRAVK